MRIKPRLLIFVFSYQLLRFVTCGPYERQSRERRDKIDDEENDRIMMQLYWNKEIPLGFFINDGPEAAYGGSDTGEETAQPTGDITVRDKIFQQQKHHDDGGSGGEDVKRDDIAPKPTQSMVLAHEKHKIEDNEKIATEEAGKLAAKIEKGSSDKKPEEAKSEKPDINEFSKLEHTSKEDHVDPGDKTKLRHSVTCQGQKEWLQCDGPYELIKIKSAFWGRDNDYTCTKAGITHGLRTDKNCAQDESNTMNKVREACDNENVCEVVASGIYFDKADCGDIYKYLSLDWECAPSESRIKETIN